MTEKIVRARTLRLWQRFRTLHSDRRGFVMRTRIEAGVIAPYCMIAGRDGVVRAFLHPDGRVRIQEEG